MFSIIVVMYSDMHAGFNSMLAAAFNDTETLVKSTRANNAHTRASFAKKRMCIARMKKKDALLSSFRAVEICAVKNRYGRCPPSRPRQTDLVPFEVKLGFKILSN
jgi:hypothetical protein